MSVSVDTDTLHRLKITKWIDFESGEKVEILIEPKDIPDFMRDVASHGGHALVDVARAISYGDCETCRNIRLVDTVLPGNRKSNKACPDCREGKHIPEPFSEYPIVGGGMTS